MRRPARLLILGASQEMIAPEIFHTEMNATRLYDGPQFRLLRAFNDAHHLGPSATAILSSQYGLLRSSYTIQRYQRRLDADRARCLSAPDEIERARRVLETLKRGDACIDLPEPWTEVFCCAGALHGQVIGAYEAAGLFRPTPVAYARGDEAARLGQLESFFARLLAAALEDPLYRERLAKRAALAERERRHRESHEAAGARRTRRSAPS